MTTVLITLGAVWIVSAIVAVAIDSDSRERIAAVLLLPVAVLGGLTIVALRIQHWPKLWPTGPEPPARLVAILQNQYRPVHWRRLASGRRWFIVLIREDKKDSDR